jgi:pilus assembly protein CpaB
MARIRIFLVLVIAVTAGGALSFATYNYVQKAGTTKTVSMPTQQVVISMSNLEIGAELQADDVKVIDWPAGAVPQGAVSDPTEVVGRGVVLPIIQFEPILPMKLASKEAGVGLPPAIPPGLRAVSVRVNEVIGVAGYVVPGTRVDVVVVVSPNQKQEDITSKVILTDVQVLAAGTKLEQDAEGAKPIAVNVVTLLVNPAEAERLTLASTEGKIQLALRNPLDRENPVTPGVKPSALLKGAAPVRTVSTRIAPTLVAAAPSASAPVVEEPPTVEIIRGDKRAREVVRDQE